MYVACVIFQTYARAVRSRIVNIEEVAKIGVALYIRSIFFICFKNVYLDISHVVAISVRE